MYGRASHITTHDTDYKLTTLCNFTTAHDKINKTKTEVHTLINKEFLTKARDSFKPFSRANFQPTPRDSAYRPRFTNSKRV